MRQIANWSIKTKLRFFTAIAVSLALLFASLAFVVQDADSVRETKRQELNTLAEILGFSTILALESQNRDAANAALSALHIQASIECALVYDRHGNLFAVYPVGLPVDGIPLVAASRGTVTSKNHLEVTQDIYQAGLRIGTIYLRSDMRELTDHFRHYLRIVLGVMIAALLTAVLVADRLQRILTQPIHELAQTMWRVSTEGDYSLRVACGSSDELGILGNGLNRMLEQIQQGRNALQSARDELEHRVAERTAELSRANSHLQDAVAETEAANRAKSAFLANMSHEIRTPMTAIQGFADLLIDPNHSADERWDYLNTIRTNSQHLLAIINDILDLSKIEAGKMTVERIPCSPSQLMAEVTSLMRARARSKNLALDVEYANPIPESIQTDPTRLRQIVINLIGNAIKFTEHGGVRLVLGMSDAEGTNPQLSVQVIDTGLGMTVDQTNRIFQAFTQADETMARRFGGTGLGLTISKRFAEMLGGEITVESELNKGSKFKVTVETGSLQGVRMLDSRSITIKPMPHESAKQPALPVASFACRVLLVEDGADNQRLISFVLKKAGVDVTLADNGQIGLEKALANHEAGTPFDVILMDMQMPVLDGYSATARLRAEGYTRPIIALTAHSMSHDRDKCLTSGCDDYAAKPIDRRELLQKVLDWAKRSQEAATCAGDQTSH